MMATQRYTITIDVPITDDRTDYDRLCLVAHLLTKQARRLERDDVRYQIDMWGKTFGTFTIAHLTDDNDRSTR